MRRAAASLSIEPREPPTPRRARSPCRPGSCSCSDDADRTDAEPVGQRLPRGEEAEQDDHGDPSRGGRTASASESTARPLESRGITAGAEPASPRMIDVVREVGEGGLEDPRSVGVGAQPSKAASVLGSISVARRRRGRRRAGTCRCHQQHGCVSASDRARIPARRHRADERAVPRPRRGADGEPPSARTAASGGRAPSPRPVLDQGELVARAPTRRATAVPRLVGHDGKDPRSSVPSRWPPSARCALTRRLARRPPRPRDPQIHVLTGWRPVGRRTSGAQGIEVTLLRSASELDVGRWTALHRPILAQVEPTRTRRATSARCDQAEAPSAAAKATTTQGKSGGPTPAPRGGGRAGGGSSGCLERGPSGRAKVSHLGWRAFGVRNQPPAVRSLAPPVGRAPCR